MHNEMRDFVTRFALGCTTRRPEGEVKGNEVDELRYFKIYFFSAE